MRAVCTSDAAQIAALMGNELQASAVRLTPALEDMMDAGMMEGALQGIVSGSGPTVLFLVRDAASAAQLAGRLEERTGAWAIPVSGPASGARLL